MAIIFYDLALSASTAAAAAPRREVSRMGNKGSGGPFAPLVVVVRNIVGEKDFNKLRGKAISLHSQSEFSTPPAKPLLAAVSGMPGTCTVMPYSSWGATGGCILAMHPGCHQQMQPWGCSLLVSCCCSAMLHLSVIHRLLLRPRSAC